MMRDGVLINAGAISRLMPMCLRTDAQGTITFIGPTLMKLRDENAVLGQGFFDVFSVKHHRKVDTREGLAPLVDCLLRLQFAHPPFTAFKGTLVRLGDGGFLLNLSFGIGVMDAVREYGLSVADFPDTELTIEMLYLNEAQSAVMHESRHLIRRLQGAKIAAEEKAFTDTLTGLRNRRAMDFALGRLIRLEEKFGLMHIDLDYFKGVNDTMGHAAGDYVLQHVARILVGETRSEDTVARVGGDEFVLILKGLIDMHKLRLIGERIINILERPIRFNGEELRISASVGATVSSNYASLDTAEMMRHADLALYASKDAGRARFRAFSSEMEM